MYINMSILSMQLKGSSNVISIDYYISQHKYKFIIFHNITNIIDIS